MQCCLKATGIQSFSPRRGEAGHWRGLGRVLFRPAGPGRVTPTRDVREIAGLNGRKPYVRFTADGENWEAPSVRESYRVRKKMGRPLCGRHVGTQQEGKEDGSRDRKKKKKKKKGKTAPLGGPHRYGQQSSGIRLSQERGGGGEKKTSAVGWGAPKMGGKYYWKYSEVKHDEYVISVEGRKKVRE